MHPLAINDRSTCLFHYTSLHITICQSISKIVAACLVDLAEQENLPPVGVKVTADAVPVAVTV